MKFSSATWAVAALALSSIGSSACGLFRGTPEPVAITRIGYQPFAATYRGSSIGRTTQYFDEQPTHTDFGFEYFVTADLEAATEGIAATLVLDSVLLFDGATGGILQQQADSARAMAFNATMLSDGRLTEFSGGEAAGAFAREIADRLLRPFFPIIPERGVESGAVWSDTIETRTMVNGLDNTMQLISQHAASDWTQIAGERALHIVTLSNYSFTGIGEQAGRSFTLDGTGRRHMHRYLGETGRYLGLVSVDTSDAEARIADMEMVIPIHQTRIDSLCIR